MEVHLYPGQQIYRQICWSEAVAIVRREREMEREGEMEREVRRMCEGAMD